MLQNLQQLYGRKLGATDGDIGHVKDFYFDAKTPAIRSMAAERVASALLCEPLPLDAAEIKDRFRFAL